MAKNLNIRIGEEVLPTAFHTGILARAFKEKELKAIWDAYKGARMIMRQSTPPTELQRKIAVRMQKVRNGRMVSSEMKLEYHVVTAAVQKVAVWDFLNG